MIYRCTQFTNIYPIFFIFLTYFSYFSVIKQTNTICETYYIITVVINCVDDES